MDVSKDGRAVSPAGKGPGEDAVGASSTGRGGASENAQFQDGKTPLMAPGGQNEALGPVLLQQSRRWRNRVTSTTFGHLLPPDCGARCPPRLTFSMKPCGTA